MTRRIDVHVHLAGIGGACGCSVSSRMKRSIVYHGLLHMVGAGGRDAAGATRQFADRIVELMEDATELDYACLFAMDGVYDAAGDFDPVHSHLYVPNSYVFDVAARSDKLLPVISINPQRKDALEELARWGEHAVALKWLGPLQKFDASNPAYGRFYDALKELGLPVIAHTGCEHTFPGMAQRLGDPRLYEGLLARGIPVIFSHCGTGSFLYPQHDYSGAFVELIERYDHAYGDTSAFCSLVRRNQVRRFAVARYAGRILHGSDWPIPTSALYFLPELGFDRVRRLSDRRNPLDRDVATKRAMGVPDSFLTAADALLGPRIDAWEAHRESLRRRSS